MSISMPAVRDKKIVFYEGNKYIGVHPVFNSKNGSLQYDWYIYVPISGTLTGCSNRVVGKNGEDVNLDFQA